MLLEILTPWEFRNRNNVTKINEKTEDQSYSYGCIMGYFNTSPMSELDVDTDDYKIAPEDLYDNDEHEYGEEIEFHVTVLYGLEDNKLEEDDVIRLLSMVKCPIVKCADISAFKNEKFDVLKWDIESDDLNLLNKICESIFPFKSKFPDYHAHSTIAYLMPGTSDKYSRSPNNIINKQIDYWVYSKADGKKIKITPNATGAGATVEILREANDGFETTSEGATKSWWWILWLKFCAKHKLNPVMSTIEDDNIHKEWVDTYTANLKNQTA